MTNLTALTALDNDSVTVKISESGEIAMTNLTALTALDNDYVSNFSSLNHNKVNIRKWVEALESEKFNQGYGQLYNQSTNSYCCLGVAGEIAGMKLSIEHDGVIHFTDGKIGPTCSYKPIYEWLGIDSVTVKISESVENKNYYFPTLNDVDKLPFKEIAALVRKCYLDNEKENVP